MGAPGLVKKWLLKIRLLLSVGSKSIRPNLTGDFFQRSYAVTIYRAAMDEEK
jgi:hypothetical protein